MADRRTKADLALKISLLEEELRKSEAATGAARRNADFANSQLAQVRRFRKKDNERRRELRSELIRVTNELKKAREQPEPSPFEKMVSTAVLAIPPDLAEAVKEVAFDPSMSDVVKQVMGREREFPTPQRALVAACAMDPAARAYLDQRLTFKPPLALSDYQNREVVVGSGVHAAIYCAVRAARGLDPPIVIERSSRIGGAFSASIGPSFYLNSRNRPGDQAIPGIPSGALNFLPGAMVQPSDLSGDEYQSNDVLGFLARMTVASNAYVVQDELMEAGPVNTRAVNLTLDGGTARTVSRLVIATGLGDPVRFSVSDPRILNFEQFMRRMDGPFPLSGMKRVAVIGAGDSGKTAIESLCGQGPPMKSMASLDWPDAIDWYGVPSDRLTREGWEQCSRRRYRGIGRLLPSADRTVPARVNPLNRMGTVAAGYECVYIDNVPYDYVIACLGYTTADMAPRLIPGFSFSTFARNGLVLGLQAGSYPIFVIGPAAQLPVTAKEEPILRSIDENKTALFRYAPRTAAFAAT